jgi:hypothetical protein
VEKQEVERVRSQVALDNLALLALLGLVSEDDESERRSFPEGTPERDVLHAAAALETAQRDLSNALDKIGEK